MCSPGYHCNDFVATHDVRTSCTQMHELPQSHCGDNREGTFCIFFMIAYIYIYIIYIKYIQYSPLNDS